MVLHSWKWKTQKLNDFSDPEYLDLFILFSIFRKGKLYLYTKISTFSLGSELSFIFYYSSEYFLFSNILFYTLSQLIDNQVFFF